MATSQSKRKQATCSSRNQASSGRLKRKYILQIWVNHPLPEWRNLDGTVRDTKAEAQALLRDFEKGQDYFPYGTGIFRIGEFWEKSLRPVEPRQGRKVASNRSIETSNVTKGHFRSQRERSSRDKETTLGKKRGQELVDEMKNHVVEVFRRDPNGLEGGKGLRRTEIERLAGLEIPLDRPDIQREEYWVTWIIIERLLADGLVEEVKVGKTTRYRLKGKKVT